MVNLYSKVERVGMLAWLLCISRISRISVVLVISLKATWFSVSSLNLFLGISHGFVTCPQVLMKYCCLFECGTDLATGFV
jgi:hypothetical protein